MICIGGDGSLTGANILSSEWSEILDHLHKENLIDEETMKRHSHLLIVGIVGSIDNDFCGTEITIGADTALHRIVEALDAIMTTASSHQRTFIIEVMGRNCGYLALMAAVAVGADYAFIPESPTPDDWREKLCRTVKRGRDLKRRHSIIIAAEGAIDINGNKITVNDIKQTLDEKLGFDARITILGHVQRGGSPSGYDRLVSTLMGVKAVDHIINAEQNSESVVMCTQGSEVVAMPLMECVNNTRNVSKAIAERQFDKAMCLRTKEFKRVFDTYTNLARSKIPECDEIDDAIAIMNIGAPAPGMNSSVRAVARLALSKGYKVYGVNEGIRGFTEDSLRQLKWIDVDGWSNVGGSILGTNREQPDECLPQIDEVLRKYNIKGIFIIGGWETYVAAIKLTEGSKIYDSLKIPIICIPATISNNCPGTELSLGCDTGLNTIVRACDTLKQSATASRCRVFIMEVHGGKCGYLAISSFIAGGGHIAYTPEVGISLKRIYDDTEMLKKRFKKNRMMALIINTEQSNETYTTNQLEKIFREEGKGIFEIRKLVLGHIQQGDSPSPRDRILGAEYANKAFEVFLESTKSGKPISCGIGFSVNGVTYTELSELIKNMDFKNRRPKHQQWEHLRVIVEKLT